MYIGGMQLNTIYDRNINERIRRQSALEAYQKDENYHKRKADKIAQFLIEEFVDNSEPQVATLGAGQVKQVHLPIGKSLEETIALWQGVRAEALTEPEPTTADYQLASKASMNIRRLEAQLGLDQQASSEVDAAVHQERQFAFTRMTEEFLTPIEETLYNHKKKHERAVTAYTFQVQMKLNGFKVNTPSFLKIA